jgi:hypothetical protein
MCFFLATYYINKQKKKILTERIIPTKIHIIIGGGAIRLGEAQVSPGLEN